MAPPTSRHFVTWDEEYVSNDRGSRVVHYYLKDRHGNAKLAVVGTERSLRHMVYVVSEEFLHLTSNSKSGSSSSMKWRSRREVVDWLTSLSSKPRPASSGDYITNITKSPRSNLSLMSDTDVSNDEMVEPANHIRSSKGHLQRKPRATSRDVAWLGSPWTCRKQLTHYQSFCRNGITISVHDFVYMSAEGREHCIAYLEDMFEDSKARKLVRVQWFHKTNEVLENIPPPVPHARELFFASCSQVLNVKCVDGLATVLIPEHYEECWAKLPPEAAAQLYMCYRQFDNGVIKSFDLSQLEGYCHQKVLFSTDVLLPRYSPKHDLTSDSWDLDEEQETNLSTGLNKGPRKPRKSRSSRRWTGALSHGCRHMDAPDSLYRLSVSTEVDEDNNCTPDTRPPIKTMVEKSKEDVHRQGLMGFDIGDKVELLSQDSGIRGCWFKCTVISKQPHLLKVRYEDVQNEDGSNNLEEWIQAFRVAAPDKLGIRVPGRLTVRPYPPEEETSNSIVVGTAVDAWWNDGWWEGVVVMIHESKAEVHVYFPGENERSIFKRRDLRLSRDWVNNQWTLVKEALDVAATQVSCDKKDGLQSMTLPVRCTVYSGLDELTNSAACTKRRFSPSSSVALRQSSELEGGGNSHSNESNMELKEEVGVDSASSEREQRACNLVNDGLLGDLRWKSSRKRKRTREATVLSKTNSPGGKHTKMSRRKMMDGNRLKNGEDLLECNKKELAKRQRSGEELIKAKRLRQGHENLKPVHGCPIVSPLFTNPMPLSNLVMSR